MTIDPQLLHSLPFFAALPDDELRLLADKMRRCEFEAGALVLREGEACNEFYIVVSGQVDIVKALGTPDERLLAVRPAVTMVGELSLFSPGGRHTASVRAHTSLELLEMTRADFDRLLARQPLLAYGMLQTLSLRLIESEQLTIHDLREKNEALARAYAALQAAQAKLVEKEKLERELEVARRIQRSLLPSHLPACPGYDFGALMEPMSAVGGDFYDFVVFDDGRVGVAVGDVSDHGVPAALFMVMTVTLLRAAARRDPAPAGVLRSVNHDLLEVNTAGMFVTVLYGVLDLPRRAFTYARAGHELPLLQVAAAAREPALPRAADESGMWMVDRSHWANDSAGQNQPKPAALPRDRFARRKTKGGAGTNPLTSLTDQGHRTAGPASSPVPRASSTSSPVPRPSALKRGQLLGIVPDPELDVQRLELPRDSTLLLYTDGVREATDPAGNMFGDAGLRAVLAESAHDPAQVVCDRIFQRLAAHRGPVPQQDDMTLVTVKSGV